MAPVSFPIVHGGGWAAGVLCGRDQDGCSSLCEEPAAQFTVLTAAAGPCCQLSARRWARSPGVCILQT